MRWSVGDRFDKSARGSACMDLEGRWGLRTSARFDPEVSSPISDADALEQPVGDAQAIVETAPVANAGDAADDVAIWRDPANPARSIVIGNDKLGALEVYDMSGALIQRFDGGFYGNVDTRTGMQTGSGSVDIAVTYRLGIRVFGINPTTRQLANITDGAHRKHPFTRRRRGDLPLSECRNRPDVRFRECSRRTYSPVLPHGHRR